MCSSPATPAGTGCPRRSSTGRTFRLRRRNQKSDLRWLNKFAGLPPKLVADDLKVAREILARTAPAAFSMKKRHFANTASGIRGAFKSLRLLRQPPAGMSPAFRALFDRIPQRELGYRLSRPFTFWSGEGLQSGAVTTICSMTRA